MDDFMAKFKALDSKAKIGVYAGLATFVFSFFSFGKFDFGGLGFGYDGSTTVWSWFPGILVPVGGIAGAVLLVMGQKLNGFFALAGAAACLVIAILRVVSTGTGYGLAFGAFLLIASAAVGVWATLDSFLNRDKTAAGK